MAGNTRTKTFTMGSLGDLVKNYMEQVHEPPKKNFLFSLKPDELTRARMAYHIPPEEQFIYTFQANLIDTHYITPENRFYFTEKGIYGKRPALLGAENVFISWKNFIEAKITRPTVVMRYFGNILCVDGKNTSMMWNGITSGKGTDAWLSFYHGLQGYLKAASQDVFRAASMQESRQAQEKAGNTIKEVKTVKEVKPVKEAKPGVDGALKSELAVQTPLKSGHLSIPEGTEKIRIREYDGRSDIVSVTIPGTVKEIGDRAFAECKNLTTITLCEGVEVLGENVFTDCPKLEEIKLPASIKEICGWTFYHSGIKTPVFTASGEKLVYCPKEEAGEKYIVPSGVKEIGVQAFIHMPELKSIVFPEGLEIIRNRAFIDCGITEIVLPVSIKRVEKDAFCNCLQVTSVIQPAEKDPLIAYINSLEIRGANFVCAAKLNLPKDQYWKTESFIRLAQRCADSDSAAMNEMADYFENKYDGNELFYRCASQFWRYRAYLYGNQEARVFLTAWIKGKKDQQMASPFLSGNLSGSGEGICFNALGFLFFKEDREYCLEGMDGDGVVLVSSYESEDGPDDDGFGRETYYDWWYLDDCLNLPKEVKCLNSYSSIDRQSSSAKKAFKETHDKVAGLIRQKYNRSRTMPINSDIQ